jgi:hypothetical protein
MNKGRLIAQENVSRIAAKGGYRELESYFLTVVSKDNESRSAGSGAPAAEEGGGANV